MKKPEGAWALVICALGWSLGGVFLKYVNVNSFAIAGLRSTFAFIAMAAMSRYLPSFYVKDENSGKVDKAQTVYLWLSALSYAATMIMYVISNKLTYAANVILLQYTSPVWVILFSAIILGEKNRKIDYISFAGIAVGMVLFFVDSLMENQSGEFADTALLGNTITALSASLITMIEPLMNPMWVFIFVHEILTVKCIVGGLIILGFILLREFVSKKRVLR